MEFGANGASAAPAISILRRRLRLAGICFLALSGMLAARGDSHLQSEDLASKAFLNSITNVEGYCYGHFGQGRGPDAPSCSGRFGACMSVQNAARERLNAEWESLRPDLRRDCVRHARSEFERVRYDPAIRSRLDEGGYRRPFAHDAVERCVARRLRRPRPAAFSPGVCTASTDRPRPRPF
jgi:hypothetical protein